MYNKTILDNGLTVITEELPFFQSVSIGLWADTGSRNETDKTSGISHFIEHMLFKGTSTRTASDIAELMDGIGGHMNAFTEKEHTCMYARVLGTHAEMATELLFDMVLNSAFSPTELERERKVILDEIRMYEDSPEDMVMDMFSSLIWRDSFLGRPVLGTLDSVSSLSRDDMLEYLSRYYSAENLIICAAGNIKHDEFVKYTLKHADLLKRGVPKKSSVTVLKDKESQVKFKDCEQVYMVLGREGLPQSDDRKYTLSVIDSVLGSSMSSRIFQEVREKRGLAYNIGSFFTSLSDTGLFGIFSGSSPDSLREIIDVSADIISTMRHDGISTEELARAKEQLKGSLALSLESALGRMMRLAKSEFYYNRLIPPEEIFEKIDSVTLERLNELASSILDIDLYSSCVLGPVSADFKIL